MLPCVHDDSSYSHWCVLLLQLNENDADNLAVDVNADDSDEQLAEQVTVSPVKTKKKRKKKAKDKSSSDSKAVVFHFFVSNK